MNMLRLTNALTGADDLDDLLDELYEEPELHRGVENVICLARQEFEEFLTEELERADRAHADDPSAENLARIERLKELLP